MSKNPQVEVLTDYDPKNLKTALSQLAWLMDGAFVIPGTNIRVGLDALIGLVPVLGDLLTGMIQTAIVMLAVSHYRVPRPIAARMAANVLLDTALGAIPFLGDIFDVAFKANTRNIRLLEQVVDHRSRGEQVRTWPSILFLVGIGVVLTFALLGVAVAVVAVCAWVWKQIAH